MTNHTTTDTPTEPALAPVARVARDGGPDSAAAGPAGGGVSPGGLGREAAAERLARLDAELDEVRANVGHGEAQYNPWALQALRAAEALVAELADLDAEYAKTRSNLDEFAEGALETQRQLTAERDGARQVATDAIRDLDAARAGWSGVLAAHLRFLVQAIEQAQAAKRRGDEPDWQAAWRAVRSAAGQAAACLGVLDHGQPPPVRTGGVVRPRTLAEIRGEHGSELGDLVQAQTLYAGLPNLPIEPAVAAELEPHDCAADGCTPPGADHG